MFFAVRTFFLFSRELFRVELDNFFEAVYGIRECFNFFSSSNFSGIRECFSFFIASFYNGIFSVVPLPMGGDFRFFSLNVLENYFGPGICRKKC